jgi:hypothetical protein
MIVIVQAIELKQTIVASTLNSVITRNCEQ